MTTEYNETTGFSPLDQFNESRLRRQVAVNARVIRDRISLNPGERILVAGAGVGREAVLVCEEFQKDTVGVDLNVMAAYLPGPFIPVSLQVQNLQFLALADGSFSLVYCYHVLEHVTDPHRVIEEFYRVLKAGGTAFIGFPNKNRLISYIGTSQNVVFSEKVKWNLIDLKCRLSGRFENRLGAHAGFTQREFMEMVRNVFDATTPVRNQYMLYKYPKWKWLIELFERTGLSEMIFPSNYFLCYKSKNGSYR
ncbi:MAG: class I SAM-dependent methyltransferase [Leptolinea sp.]|jgi:ubiquinone/menaquinone biosynthesis C-methylase UbiE|nr:class I SAM-dependent methyltransferase [Leptolinea sp.]